MVENQKSGRSDLEGIARPKVMINMKTDTNAVRIPAGDRGARSGAKRLRLEVLGCAEALVVTRIGYLDDETHETRQ